LNILYDVIYLYLTNELKLEIMRTIKNLDTVTKGGLIVLTTVVLPLLVMITIKVLSTSNIIF